MIRLLIWAGLLVGLVTLGSLKNQGEHKLIAIGNQESKAAEQEEWLPLSCKSFTIEHLCSSLNHDPNLREVIKSSTHRLRISCTDRCGSQFEIVTSRDIHKEGKHWNWNEEEFLLEPLVHGGLASVSNSDPDKVREAVTKEIESITAELQKHAEDWLETEDTIASSLREQRGNLATQNGRSAYQFYTDLHGRLVQEENRNPLLKIQNADFRRLRQTFQAARQYQSDKIIFTPSTGARHVGYFIEYFEALQLTADIHIPSIWTFNDANQIGQITRHPSIQKLGKTIQSLYKRLKEVEAQSKKLAEGSSTDTSRCLTVPQDRVGHLANTQSEKLTHHLNSIYREIKNQMDQVESKANADFVRLISFIEQDDFSNVRLRFEETKQPLGEMIVDLQKSTHLSSVNQWTDKYLASRSKGIDIFAEQDPDVPSFYFSINCDRIEESVTELKPMKEKSPVLPAKLSVEKKTAVLLPDLIQDVIFLNGPLIFDDLQVLFVIEKLEKGLRSTAFVDSSELTVQQTTQICLSFGYFCPDPSLQILVQDSKPSAFFFPDLNIKSDKASSKDHSQGFTFQIQKVPQDQFKSLVHQYDKRL